MVYFDIRGMGCIPRLNSEDSSLEYWIEKTLRYAESVGVEFADVRGQRYQYELVVVDNGRLREYSRNRKQGIGLRVVVDGRQAYSSISRFTEREVKKAVDTAVRTARALSRSPSERIELAEYGMVRDKVSSKWSIDPFEVDTKSKLDVTLTMNRSALEIRGVSSAVTRFGAQRDYRIVANTEGTWVTTETVMVGVAHASVAQEAGEMEVVTDYTSKVAGWEYIESSRDRLVGMAVEVSKLAGTVVKSKHPKAGVYEVILEPEIVGLFLHEALGHASEGDLVTSGGSVLRGKEGTRLAPEFVTIVDDGLAEGGYYVPYDDEGVRKKTVRVVDRGVLKGYLASREEAAKLGVEPTGNARVMDYTKPVIVRQTNYYMLPGDRKSVV